MNSRKFHKLWSRTTLLLQSLTAPTLLLMRLFVPALAAALATWTELVLPWLLAFGLGSRIVAVVLFVYNIVAVISYPALWPNGFWHGLIGSDFDDHKAWGLMLLALIAWGAGRWSLDALLARWWPPATAREAVCSAAD